MDNAIVRSIRKDIGSSLYKLIKEHRISQARLSKLTGLGTKVLWSITSGKNDYKMNSYILVMGTIDEIIGVKNYSALNIPYKAINKYGIVKKCDTIENVVSDYIGISKEFMKSKSRFTEQIKARMYCYALELKFTRISKSDVADRFGLDHATILNALKRFNNLIDTKDPLVSDYDELYKVFEKRWNKENINLKESNE